MAAKPKKAVRKRVPAKKTSKKVARKQGVEVDSGKKVDAEIIPDLMNPDVMEQVAQVEGVIAAVEEVTDPMLVESIKSYATQVESFSRQAVKAAASALVYAWACGKLLNTAKDQLGHGAFGKWRKEHLESASISERSSTRYMKLAAECPDVRGLLQWAQTLKQAYIGCGVLPPPPEKKKDEPDENETPEEKRLREEEEGKKEVLKKKEVLLASVSDLQQKLHQGISVKGNLDRDELRQLKLAKIEIDNFFNQILDEDS